MVIEYEIELTYGEHQAILWMTNRGYFPKDLADVMYSSDEEEEDRWEGNREAIIIWMMPEPEALSILGHRESDPDSLFACASPSLLAKLLKLEEEISHGL